MAETGKQFDAAALAGATLAAVLAVMTGEGKWEPVSIVVGATLFLIVAAYERDRSRTAEQTLALAAVNAFVCLLIAAPLLELLLEGLGLNAPPASPVNVPAIRLGQTEPSRIPEAVLPGLWLLFLFFGVRYLNSGRFIIHDFVVRVTGAQRWAARDSEISTQPGFYPRNSGTS